jgi:hypothetical protein
MRFVLVVESRSPIMMMLISFVAAACGLDGVG